MTYDICGNTAHGRRACVIDNRAFFVCWHYIHHSEYALGRRGLYHFVAVMGRKGYLAEVKEFSNRIRGPVAQYYSAQLPEICKFVRRPNAFGPIHGTLNEFSE